MIITEIQYFSSKIIRFQAIFKDTVEFTCALEFKISSQQLVLVLLYLYRKMLLLVIFCKYRSISAFCLIVWMRNSNIWL